MTGWNSEDIKKINKLVTFDRKSDGEVDSLTKEQVEKAYPELFEVDNTLYRYQICDGCYEGPYLCYNFAKAMNFHEGDGSFESPEEYDMGYSCSNCIERQ